MLLSFVVGKTTDVFGPSLAAGIDSELERELSVPAATTDEESYRSDEIDYRGWSQLQQRAATLGISAPHLRGVEAYQGGFAPADFAQPRALMVPGAADPILCGSLPRLLEELVALAAAASLPTDEIELMGLAAHYLEDDTLFDRDLDVQTFVQLMLSAGQARVRRQPVWIVIR